MADQRVEECVRLQDQLEIDRAVWDQHWTEVAERVLPRQDDFLKQRTGGEKRTEKIFDATAILALDRAASAVDSLITPATQQWHGLEPEDERLLDDQETMIWCGQLTKQLFRMRYRPLANFASQAHECYVSLMAFGNLGMFVDDVIGIGTRYKSIAMSELYFQEDANGMVDLVHRKFQFTARQALQKFGNQCPEKVRKCVDTEPLRKFDFLHVAMPNPEIVMGAKDYRAWAVRGYYIFLEGRELLTEGGYRTMPYLVSRHVTAPRETYGRSPAMMVLPDIKMVNEMEKTIIRAAHKIVDPPLLIYGDGILSAFNARPNALNYGGVDEQGRQLVHPLKTGSNLPIALEMTEQKRKVINDAFYVTLFQILVQNPQMTATEAMIRAQEKGQLLAPTVGRQQSEFIGPKVMREIDILSAAGAIPPLPPAMRRSGGGIKVTYTSPLSRLRRAEDGVAIMRTLEGVGPLSQVKPEVMDTFDEDAVVRELAEINGVPAKILRSPDAIAQIRAKRQQDAQMQSLVTNAESAGKAASSMADAAQKVGFTVPATQP